MLIDTHAHLYFDQFKGDLENVIARAKDQNLTNIINIGTDLKTSQKAAKLQNNQLGLYSSIGIHPHHATEISTDESIHQNVRGLEEIYQTNTDKVVAIGEAGLDYYSPPDLKPSPLSLEKARSLQRRLFQVQIDLARKLKLPLIIHCRNDASANSVPSAWQEIFDFNHQGINGVFHSFSSNLENAKKALDLGFYLGFNCTVTYPKNNTLREILKQIPLDRILTETDCPFLPPQSLRGQRNEPANVVEVVKVIAQVKGLPWDKVATQAFQNALDLFQLN